MINLTFSLTAQIPSGKNAVKITRTGMRYPDKRFKAWRDDATKELLGQVTQENWPINKPVAIVVDYVPSDMRRRDMPGMLDAICHLIEKVGMLTDDCLVHQMSWKTFTPDKGNAGCRITVMG